MALTNEQITAKNFKDFYTQIRPYLNGAAHSGFTPVGTVISVMGKSAPMNYLACNGQVVNIADYPELATYFNTQFGSPNYFGGNGTTTFGIPDLRGEFLRGTGTNSRTGQGSGAEVGVHQNATTINPGWANNNSGGFSRTRTATSAYSDLLGFGDTDSSINLGTRNSLISDLELRLKSDTGADVTVVSTRPTNTSVLYCIATKNIFMDAGSNYSTDEQVVGTWVDGKPVYQKTITGTTPSTIGTQTVIAEGLATNVNEIVSIDSLFSYVGDSSLKTLWLPMVGINNGLNHIIKIMPAVTPDDTLCLSFYNTYSSWANRPYICTVKYTKTTD